MENSNKKKNEQLGMSHGKAQGRLRKSIMFFLAQKTGYDICYQCNEKIISVDDLSIEHKIPWLDSEDPTKLFFDLNNIAFSHLKCNVDAARSDTPAKLNHNKKFQQYVGLKNEDSPTCKISDTQVLEIRKLLKEGNSLREIAKKFNISHSHVHEIKHNKQRIGINP